MKWAQRIYDRTDNAELQREEYSDPQRFDPIEKKEKATGKSYIKKHVSKFVREKQTPFLPLIPKAKFINLLINPEEFKKKIQMRQNEEPGNQSENTPKHLPAFIPEPITYQERIKNQQRASTEEYNPKSIRSNCSCGALLVEAAAWFRDPLGEDCPRTRYREEEIVCTVKQPRRQPDASRGLFGWKRL